jgi:hypothetical protein
MVRLTLRVVGRSIFCNEVERAIAVLDSAFPVLNRHTFRPGNVTGGHRGDHPAAQGPRAGPVGAALSALAATAVSREKSTRRGLGSPEP